MDYAVSCTSLYINTDILKNTELYTLNKWIVRYVNDISVKLLLKERKRKKERKEEGVK